MQRSQTCMEILPAKTWNVKSVMKKGIMLQPVTTARQSDNDAQDCAFLGEVDIQTTRPWMEKVHVNGETMNFKARNQLKVKSCFQDKNDGKRVTSAQYVYVVAGQHVYIVAGLIQPLLDLPAIEAVRLVHRVDDVAQWHRLR